MATFKAIWRQCLLVAAFAALTLGADPAGAHKTTVEPPTESAYEGEYEPGTIIVNTAERRLYLVTAEGMARVYQIGVGRAGTSFKGEAEVARKAKWPSWKPTRNMMRRDPKLRRWARGMRGGPGNPLGARALYLYKDGRDTMYRIHGTNKPSSVGGAESSGCIRLLNEHVKDLYERVPVGARVVVL